MSSEYQFEGKEVSDFQAKLPAITVECDHYKSGTVLRLAVEVRVKGVSYEEDKDGNYIRQHKLGYQDIAVVSAFDPADANDQVGGSLSGSAPSTDIDTGLDVKVTGDQWPQGVAKDPKTGRVVDTETGEVLTEGEFPVDTDARSDDDEDTGVAARESVEIGF